MNSIDFLKYTEFPVSAETYNFMQGMIGMLGKLASLGGTNCILSGCEDGGGTVSPGYVIINGEILPFVGGTKTSYVIIDEAKTSVQVYDSTYEGLYTIRVVKFGTGTGQLEWASFARITDMRTMAASLAMLSNAFASHTENHTVAWDKVQGKPSTYPPSEHGHTWAQISGKPSGRFAYFGLFTYDGQSGKLGGDLPSVDITRVSTGRYKLAHNMGHQQYLVLGVSYDMGLASIVSMPVRENNYCEVIVADDTSPNNTGNYFVIISFQ